MDFINELVDCFEKGSIKKLSIEVNGIVYDKKFNINGNKLTAESSTNSNDSLTIYLDDLVDYVANKRIDIKINF